jgi:membrane protein
MFSVIRKFSNLLFEAGNEFIDDHATKLSASLAYYTIFAIGPLLLVIITLLGFFYKKPYVTTSLFDKLAGIIGKQGATQLHGVLDNISRQNNTTLFGIIGGIVLVFSATSIFTEIQSSINYIWSIRAKPKRSWLKYITDRLLSFVLVLGLGLLMIISLLLNLLTDLLNSRLTNFLGDADYFLLKGTNIGLMFLIVTLLFTIIYKVLPDAGIAWIDALIGASFTGVLFLIGKFLITYYLGISKSINAYGAAASIILLLTWVYYSSMILYYGAEFTKVYAMKWGHGITVSENAVYIIKREAKELPLLKHPVNKN